MLQQKIRRSTVDVLFLKATRRVNVVTRCRISAFLFLFSVGVLDQYLHLLVCPLSPTSARNIISGLLWDDPGSVFSTVVVSDYKKKYLLIHITVLFFHLQPFTKYRQGLKFGHCHFCGFHVVRSRAFRYICQFLISITLSGNLKNGKILVKHQILLCTYFDFIMSSTLN